MADSKKYDGNQWEHSIRKQTTASEVIVPPTTIYTNGNITYNIKGNTVIGVGERTENLFDDKNCEYGKWVNSDGTVLSNANYAACYTISISDQYYNIKYHSSKPYSYSMVFYDSSNNFIERSHRSNPNVNGDLFEAPNTAVSAIVQVTVTPTDTMTPEVLQVMQLMVNAGSTAAVYEPYGYKIPIITNQTTTNIYIGENPLRKSLDGTAADELSSNGTMIQRVDIDGSVLVTPVVTQITAPSLPTIEGANTISIDTTVQPSEFTATYTGWHDSTVKEWDGSQWQ